MVALGKHTHTTTRGGVRKSLERERRKVLYIDWSDGKGCFVTLSENDEDEFSVDWTRTRQQSPRIVVQRVTGESSLSRPYDGEWETLCYDDSGRYTHTVLCRWHELSETEDAVNGVRYDAVAQYPVDRPTATWLAELSARLTKNPNQKSVVREVVRIMRGLKESIDLSRTHKKQR